MKNEIFNVLSGKSEVSFGTTIQSITRFLNNGEKASPTIESDKHFKKQEAKKLEHYISKNNLWVTNIDFSKYVSKGAEQKVYLTDSKHVLKLNDSVLFYDNFWKT